MAFIPQSKAMIKLKLLSSAKSMPLYDITLPSSYLSGIYVATFGYCVFKYEATKATLVVPSTS